MPWQDLAKVYVDQGVTENAIDQIPVNLWRGG
jgi:hypothetical protein